MKDKIANKNTNGSNPITTIITATITNIIIINIKYIIIFTNLSNIIYHYVPLLLTLKYRYNSFNLQGVMNEN